MVCCHGSLGQATGWAKGTEAQAADHLASLPFPPSWDAAISSVILGLWEGAAGRLLGDPGTAALCLPASLFTFPFPFWTRVSPAPSVGICRAGGLAVLSSLWTRMPTRLLGVGVLFCGDPSSPRCLRTVESPQTWMLLCRARLHTHAHSCTLVHRTSVLSTQASSPTSQPHIHVHG